MSTVDKPSSDPNLRFGPWLRRCRETAGLTRKSFAAAANVGELVLRSIEVERLLATPAQRRRLVAALASFAPELAATAPEGACD